MSQTAAHTLHHDHGEGCPHNHNPVRNAYRQGQDKQQPRDQGGAVGEGVALAGDHPVQPLKHQAGCHGGEGQGQHPGAEEIHTGSKGRQKGQHHPEHQLSCGLPAVDMGGGIDYEIHTFLASFTICLPFRKVATRGSFPGQPKLQQPHSMQSMRFSRLSSERLPLFTARYI